ncbi:MexH family multidrug efflux RND transporter periplasmic adaptor subunit [Pseudomonas monteilii]|uniref:Efflux transporter periplasmic adaptor subunit n=1 Tax=Pseudomonas monteilii TaxID=76759 RepID=A0AAP7KGZ8_9PSED|nr:MULTISPECIES: efflux RND transporter periplasmic adaptor subunit [Pseudomonas]AYN15216.1 MexH family multidrug efflux RND transporter periplasmic adaptor subunit [Pseudomonas monteilii]AYO01172.1 efflux RND transporter periplasmic adaptor subunit [Pseudomonas sp. LTGT-11-2Z]MBA6101363.1 efflux RND transporter periplasmic adaptor subunit [Pseudomonas monteilii]MCE0873078.1 efflux RND transporter periplasmic adaptor subunit [Pseudomonas monteilii]MCE0926434.1 efflux RND transporter periplasmi
MNKRTLLACAGVVAGVLAGAYALVGNSSMQPSAAAWPATKVALATAEQVQVARQNFASGELEAVNQVQVAAEVAGRITRIAFESGQTVTAGQVLVQLNDAPEQAQRVQLRAKLRNAEVVLQRSRKLLAMRAVSQELFDNAATAVDVASGELQHVEALIAQKAIRAPFAGKLGIRRVHQGQYLGAGETIVSLADTRQLHVNFSLGEQAAPDVQVGQVLALGVDAVRGQGLQAQVVAVDPVVSKARLVQVQAALANPNGQLQPGMYASVRLDAAQPSTVLAVPETAITYTAYGQTVFVATRDAEHGTRVKRVQVTTGERWQGRVEVTSGLAPGDQVVVSGQLKLNDGMSVEPVTQDSLQASQGGRQS